MKPLTKQEMLDAPVGSLFSRQFRTDHVCTYSELLLKEYTNSGDVYKIIDTLLPHRYGLTWSLEQLCEKCLYYDVTAELLG